MKDLDLSLYLVTDESENENKFLKTVKEAIEGGVSIVQIREKTADTLDFYKLAKKVKKITDKSNVPLIINDRVDIALAIDASGVHVGQSDMPCNVTRNLIGPDKILGVSAHTIKEAKKAQRDGADYLGCGAVFPTSTKNNANRVTKNELNKIIKSVNIPVVAIGGININNACELTDLNISGLSVVSAIMNSDNPKKSSEELLKIFNS